MTARPRNFSILRCSPPLADAGNIWGAGVHSLRGVDFRIDSSPPVIEPLLKYCSDNRSLVMSLMFPTKQKPRPTFDSAENGRHRASLTRGSLSPRRSGERGSPTRPLVAIVTMGIALVDDLFRVRGFTPCHSCCSACSLPCCLALSAALSLLMSGAPEARWLERIFYAPMFPGEARDMLSWRFSRGDYTAPRYQHFVCPRPRGGGLRRNTFGFSLSMHHALLRDGRIYHPSDPCGEPWRIFLARRRTDSRWIVSDEGLPTIRLAAFALGI